MPLKRFRSFGSLLLILITGCSTGTLNKTKPMKTQDPHSFSRPNEIVVRHIDLDLSVDFNAKRISGKADLTLENLSESDTLFLDTRDLTIDSVTANGKSLEFQLADAKPILGSALSILIGKNIDHITIHYRTSPEAAALQWLSPAQTAGGKHPFLFTQSQAILARTWIPLQDSPGVRFTYSAKIKVPHGLMAVMSAENDTANHANGEYSFKMPQPIPSYLMALSVGDFRFHSYDSRSGVFAEPVTLDKAAKEFTDMPAMINAAEELYGKYAWGRYDVLVLPPSFPFGGMENPRVTFATPTILAGDKSLVALIAHELAHSWSGNLVTNATWNDFWLNEGFTVYFESRIMEKLYGKPYAEMLMVLSRGELEKTVEDFGRTSPDTKLKLSLDGRDPDDGVSDIAYEKGRFFLLMLEQAYGREKWDSFVNEYFRSHAFQSITTEEFLIYLDKHLLNGDAAKRKDLRIDEWIYEPGLPVNFPKIQSVELTKVENEAISFLNGTAPEKLNTANWTTHHWLHFLRRMPAPLPLDKMESLDYAFHFTQSGNSEILCEWLLLSIRSDYTKADSALENFLTSVGRRKFVKPLFAALLRTPGGKQKAIAIYSKARPGYHSVTSSTIDEMLETQKEVHLN
jgi:leukotriene-A4 hydrolase